MTAKFKRSEKSEYENIVEINKDKILNTTDTSPECEFISALINEGKYIPGIYGIRSEQILGHKPVHNFCMQHQELTGLAPSIEVVLSNYPKFPYIKESNPVWAANRLSEAHTNRLLRKTLTQAGYAVAEDANSEAVELLRKAIQQVQPAVGIGVDATDVSVLEDLDRSNSCPVPKGMLTTVTRGISPGDLWIIAARLGIGKSWKMIEHAVAAAEAGWDVKYFSLEMNAASVVDRVHRIALRDWKQPWHEMNLHDRSERLEQWSENKGTISIYDPSRGRCDASVISSVASDNTLVIVDYVGLMHTTTGSRAIEDWRAMAMISNQLKEVALERNVPIIAAAQINRSGNSSTSTPGAEHLAQSDALGQDADALITLKRYSKHVLMNSIAKYRHGESGAKWFTRFEPTYGRFEDISAEEAARIKLEDDEADEAQIS